VAEQSISSCLMVLLGLVKHDKGKSGISNNNRNVGAVKNQDEGKVFNCVENQKKCN